MPNPHCFYILIVKCMNEILFILATLTKQANKKSGVEVNSLLITDSFLPPDLVKGWTIQVKYGRH